MSKTSQLNTLAALAQDDLIQVVDVSDTTTMTGGGGTNKKITVTTLASALVDTGSLQENIPSGTSAQYYRGDKTWATLNKGAVGLSNVTNESKATMFTNPVFTGIATLPSATSIGDVSSTELSYLNGVTSNIQAQLDGKLSSSASSTELGYLVGVTSSIQTQLNGKQNTITGGGSTITSTNLAVSRALVSDASGKVAVSSVTSTELGRLVGVSSSIQTQLDGKQNVLSNATTTVAGLMSSTDKTRLNDVSGVNGIVKCNGSGNFSVANITNSDISADANISPLKIGAGTLSNDVLVADSSITTSKIANGNITASKLSGAQTGNAPVYGVRAFGYVNSSGTLMRGEGIESVEKIALGHYLITLSISAGKMFYAVASCDESNNYNNSAKVSVQTFKTFRVFTGFEDVISPSDSGFHFMVIY